MHEHPLQRFFKSLREQPVFAWERFQMRDVLVIDHPLCQAVFSRQGAQLLHFQPRGQKPWLWCAAKWPQVGAIRGGVPVCWPWYGRHPSENAWPSHGWARLIDWKLLDSSTDDDGVRLHWQLQLCDWQVDLHAHLGETLELRLSTEHQDEHERKERDCRSREYFEPHHQHSYQAHAKSKVHEGRQCCGNRDDESREIDTCNEALISDETAGRFGNHAREELPRH